MSLQAWLERNIHQQDTRRFLSALARTITYTNAPTLLSAGVFFDQLKVSLRGVSYLDGGWQTLVDGLHETARQAQVRIVTRTRVEAIEQSDGMVCGVRLNGGSFYAARAVIIAADPNTASLLIDQGNHPRLRRYAENAFPVRAACLDMTLRRLPRPATTVVPNIDGPLLRQSSSRRHYTGEHGRNLSAVSCPVVFHCLSNARQRDRRRRYGAGSFRALAPGISHGGAVAESLSLGDYHAALYRPVTFSAGATRILYRAVASGTDCDARLPRTE